MRGDWRDRGACLDLTLEVFFPEDDRSYAAARRVCRRCPVRAECLAFALELEVTQGMFGGLTPYERAARLRAPGSEAA